MSEIQAADIVLSTTKKFFSRAIRFILRRKFDPAPFSHVAGGVGGEEIVEARHRVVKKTFELFKQENEKYAVYRRKGITKEQADKIALLMRGYEGRKYGYVKVGLLQPLDQLFRTNWFTRTLSFTKKMYCSQLWARGYFDGMGILINGVHPKSCEPDDWHDEVTNNSDNWEKIDC